MSDRQTLSGREDREPCPPGYRQVLTPYIHRGGKKIWHPEWFTKGRVYAFCVPDEDKEKE